MVDRNYKTNKDAHSFNVSKNINAFFLLFHFLRIVRACGVCAQFDEGEKWKPSTTDEKY